MTCIIVADRHERITDVRSDDLPVGVDHRRPLRVSVEYEATMTSGLSEATRGGGGELRPKKVTLELALPSETFVYEAARGHRIEVWRPR